MTHAQRPDCSPAPSAGHPRTALRRLLGTAVVALAASSAPAQETSSPQQLPTITLRAGMFNIQAQVARSPDQRAKGLMFREQMPAHEGMLFVFESATPQCFWMRNTLLPLSIAFIADDGTIVNTAEMAPKTDASHCSTKPVRYALEMNQGWFDKRGMKPGARLLGGPFGE